MLGSCFTSVTVMTMKRLRNVECSKMRRPLKRGSKITDGIYGSSLLYLRLLLVWALLLMVDFMLEFRFEYLWPVWLLAGSVYDSYKYQGLAFSVFFVCLAVTSDVICYLFIPVQWLFFIASTYVWVQYVWQTDRGICLPTISLWLLFVYIEASVRLREVKSLPFNLDLCRPFACHCIGYPMVTLGFGLKSYLSFKMRMRRQKVIHKENDFYLQMLQQALPAELQYAEHKPKMLSLKSEEDFLANGITGSTCKKSSSTSSKSDDEKDNSGKVKTSKNWEVSQEMKTTKSSDINLDVKTAKNCEINQDEELEFIEKTCHRKSSNINQFDESADNESNEQQQTASKGFRFGSGNIMATLAQAASSSFSSARSSSKWNTSKENCNGNAASSPASLPQPASTPSSSSSTKKGKVGKEVQQNPSAATYINNKDEVIHRLEMEVKKLRADLQVSRNVENELRSQVSQAAWEDKASRSELYQLQQDNENLQNKLHSLVTSRQQDKQAMTTLEKRLTEDRKSRAALESQLANEKKNKSLEAARAIAIATRNDCTDACKARRRELDTEIKQVRRENTIWEDQYRQLDREVQALRQFRDVQKETEVLVQALSAMQDKNVELENNLSAETRFKLDLFSALGKERNQIKLLTSLVAEKDQEVLELKSKIAEVMALIPSANVTSYSCHHSSQRTSSPLFSSNFCPAQDRSSNLPVFNGTDLASSSELNPNASDYTPKSAG